MTTPYTKFENMRQELLELRQSHEKLVEHLKEISKNARAYRELVCGYQNGENFCDCKYLKGFPRGEQTGCCEFRDLWNIAEQALSEAEKIK
jgi:hypothetical protein